MSWEDSYWKGAFPTSETSRTAIGFSTNPCHIFLVVSKSATWDDVVKFFMGELWNDKDGDGIVDNDEKWGLPTLVKQHPLGKNLNIKIRNALMLDGGGSTQFAYLRKDKNGNVVEEDNSAPKSDGRVIVNFVGAKAYCWDK